MYNLTDEEANVIKDVLKTIGEDAKMTRACAKAAGLTEKDFNDITDKAFIALGNGRVTIVG